MSNRGQVSGKSADSSIQISTVTPPVTGYRTSTAPAPIFIPSSTVVDAARIAPFVPSSAASLSKGTSIPSTHGSPQSAAKLAGPRGNATATGRGAGASADFVESSFAPQGIHPTPFKPSTSLHGRIPSYTAPLMNVWPHPMWDQYEASAGRTGWGGGRDWAGRGRGGRGRGRDASRSGDAGGWKGGPSPTSAGTSPTGASQDVATSPGTAAVPPAAYLSTFTTTYSPSPTAAMATATSWERTTAGAVGGDAGPFGTTSPSRTGAPALRPDAPAFVPSSAKKLQPAAAGGGGAATQAGDAAESPTGGPAGGATGSGGGRADAPADASAPAAAQAEAPAGPAVATGDGSQTADIKPTYPKAAKGARAAKPPWNAIVAQGKETSAPASSAASDSPMPSATASSAPASAATGPPSGSSGGGARTGYAAVAAAAATSPLAVPKSPPRTPMGAGAAAGQTIGAATAAGSGGQRGGRDAPPPMAGGKRAGGPHGGGGGGGAYVPQSRWAGSGGRGGGSAVYTYAFRRAPRHVSTSDDSANVLGTVAMPTHARRFLAGCLPRQLPGHIYRILTQDPAWREWCPNADKHTPPTFTDEPRVFSDRFEGYRPLRTYLDGIDKLGDKCEMARLVADEPFFPRSIIINKAGGFEPPLSHDTLATMDAAGTLWYLKEANAAHGDRIQISRTPSEFVITQGVAYIMQPEIKCQLMAGRKSDWRVYFMVQYNGPKMDVYLYRTPLHRPCLSQYKEDPSNLVGHLTNLCLQRQQPGFSFDHYNSVPQTLPDDQFEQVRTIVVTAMERTVASCESHGERGLLFMCVDVLVDADGKVWLLEFNRHPGVSDYGPPIMSNLIDPMVRDAIYQLIVPQRGDVAPGGKWIKVFTSNSLPHLAPNEYDMVRAQKDAARAADVPAVPPVEVTVRRYRATTSRHSSR